MRRNLCWARRSVTTCAKMANSESERCRRRGKTQQVMKNQRSDSTKRRSRDMRVIITLGSNPMIQNSRPPTKRRRGTQKPRTSALPAVGGTRGPSSSPLFARHLLQQPRFRQLPVAFYRLGRNLQRLSRLFHAQSAEESQLHHFALSLI
jgi:hypothetical protein